MILLLIVAAWLLILSLVVGLCAMAAMADRDEARVRGEVMPMGARRELGRAMQARVAHSPSWRRAQRSRDRHMAA